MELTGMKINSTEMCFAVRGDTIIDTVRDSLTSIYRRTLDHVRKDYPTAELMSVSDFCAAKAAKQDAEPLDLTEVTEEQYMEMLNVLPPAAMNSRGFLVGEPMDHHAGSGKPRFTCFISQFGKFYRVSNPMTHARFVANYGHASNDYLE
jgi:hypothetical protein